MIDFSFHVMISIIYGDWRKCNERAENKKDCSFGGFPTGCSPVRKIERKEMNPYRLLRFEGFCLYLRNGSGFLFSGFFLRNRFQYCRIFL